MINTDANDNSTTKLCTKTFGTIIYVTWSNRMILMVLNTAISIISSLSNALVMATLHKTKQLGNQSMKLIFALSLTNVLSAFMCQSCLAVLLFNPNKLSCPAIWFILLVIELFIYNSNYLTALLSFDRFLRIRFQYTYHQVYSGSRFKVSLVILYFFISLQAALGLVARIRGTSSTILTTPVNFILFFAVVYCYGKSIVILKRHQNRIHTTKSVDKQNDQKKGKCKKSRREATSPLTKLPTVYIVIIVIYSLPLIIVQALLYVTRHNTVTSSIAYMGRWGTIFYFAFIFFFCYYPTNAIFFLLFNKYSRSKIKSLFISPASKNKKVYDRTDSRPQQMVFQEQIMTMKP